MVSNGIIDGIIDGWNEGGARPELHGRRTAARRLIDHRVSARMATGFCVLLGMCLLSPSLWTGLVSGGVGGRVAGGDVAGAGEGAPVLSFFPRLSSFSHDIDHALWPAQPLLVHLHSLIWFGVLIAIVGAAYRRFGSTSHGFCLALVLFAIDDAHAPLVGGVGNRGAVIALCFALPALSFHDRQRRFGFVHGAWLGPLCFALGCFAGGLLAGQAALCVLAYLVAYAVCLDPGRWYARFLALSPYGAIALAWFACTHLGPESIGSGLSAGLSSDPLGFGVAACQRLLVLSLAMLAAPVADFWQLYPAISPWLRVGVLALALGVLGVFALALRPLMRRHARVHFWATGTALTLLAMLPTCARLSSDAPQGGLLLGASIGAMAVIAEMIEVGWARRDRLVPALGMAALAVVHLMIAPMLAPLRAAGVENVRELVRATGAPLALGGFEGGSDRRPR